MLNLFLFELIGNVGKLEIKPLKGDKKLAIVSLATSERWKAESGDWNEKTYWHRVVVFAPAKVALIEKVGVLGVSTNGMLTDFALL